MDSSLLTRRSLIKTAGVAGGLGLAGSLLDSDPALATGSALQINVAEYGTLGTSNDTATFQAALNAVPEGGAQVVAPYGSYKVSNLSIKSGTRIWFPGVTLVNLSGATTPCISVPTTVSQVTIAGVQIDGSQAGTGSTGIAVSGAYNRITDVYMHDTKSHGIVVQGANSPNQTTHITVDNCRVFNAGGRGITLSSAGSSDAPLHVLIEANHVKNSQAAALGILGVGLEVLFSNNIAENTLPSGQGGEGCAAYSHLNSNVICVGNSFYSVALQGIHLGGSRVSALGNLIYQPVKTGILIASDESSVTTNDFEVSGNTIYAPGTTSAPFTGIFTEGMAGGTVGANIIESATAHGINITKCSTVSVAGNMIKSPGAGNCVEISSSQRVSVTGNVGYGATSGYGVHVSSASPASTDISVVGNALSANGLGGVASVAEATRVTVSGNTIYTGGAGTAVSLNGASNRVAANYTDTSATIPSATKLSVPRDVTLATVTGSTTITELDNANVEVGQMIFLRFRDGCTIQSGSNLVLASTFTTPANGVLSLVCDGTKWYETARSVD
jgi:hypothetical protein